MSRHILSIALVVLCAGVGFAQETSTGGSASARSATSATAGKALDLQAGTQLAAQLQSALDVRRAKVGDQVVLKTTEAIRGGGRTIVPKGARLIGRVTEVQQRARGRGESSIGLVFDRLESGSLATPISATITSITQARTRARTDDGFGSDTSAQTTTSARSSSSSSSSRQSSGGGLLGNVTGAVGGVVDSTARTTGSVVGGTTGAVGETVGGVTESVGGIRISQSSDTSVEGGTTLSLTGDNLRLEKGTSFRLRLNQAASVGNN